MDKDNSGALFKNKDKQSEQHPDYKGSVTVGGQAFWLSAWINTAKASGEKYMKLSLKAKDQQPTAEAPKPAPAADDEFGDEIPF